MKEDPELKNNLPDHWNTLRSLTSSRIGIGRTGHSIPLAEQLQFRLAHAHARDAVYASLHLQELQTALEKYNLPVLSLHSRVLTREEYLQRPDSGRRLAQQSVDQLLRHSSYGGQVAIVVADGLSALAIQDHACSLLDILIPSLTEAAITRAPITIVEQGRVAIADEIGALLQAQVSLILIGERPGLSSPNSLGAYLTYHPTIGLTDESRNCVSNIRPEGLTYPEAAAKIFYLISESLRRKLSGVNLKEESRTIQ